MALNLNNLEVDALAAEVAELAGESKTEAVRKALLERKARLLSLSNTRNRSQRAAVILEQFRATLSPKLLGVRLSRKEEDEILGFGPGGV